MPNPLMADLVFALHLAFINAVILLVPLIIAGGVRGWAWVRTPWIRLAHLGMIGFVAAESLLHVRCPLTTLETGLRGEERYGGAGFFGALMHRLVFYDLPHWVFVVLYVGYALLVLGLLFAVPLRWHRPHGCDGRGA